MSEEYVPKSSGESYVKRVLGKHRTIKRRSEERGIKFTGNTINIPVAQAEEIVEKHDIRGPAVSSLRAIVEELQTQLNRGYETYSPTALRSLAARARFFVDKIR